MVGILSILEELKVGKIVITKQIEESSNYKEFIKKVKEKKLKVIIVEKGSRVKIEKDLYFNILWPNKKQIEENVLNNNAMVMKMEYKKFSMLFTGDIEKIAEKKILEEYDNKEKNLKANILKVAHHGSKTSSKKEFIKLVDPKIAIIGVGKNNMFKHPSEEVIKRLEKDKIKIYRTDESGEISFFVDRKGRIIKTTVEIENW